MRKAITCYKVRSSVRLRCVRDAVIAAAPGHDTTLGRLMFCSNSTHAEHTHTPDCEKKVVHTRRRSKKNTTSYGWVAAARKHTHNTCSKPLTVARALAVEQRYSLFLLVVLRVVLVLSSLFSSMFFSTSYCFVLT